MASATLSSERKRTKSRRLPLPTVFPTQGQKWSKRLTHLFSTAQCLLPSGRTILHDTHSEPQFPAQSAGRSTRLLARLMFARPRPFPSSPTVSTPGSLKAVR